MNTEPEYRRSSILKPAPIRKNSTQYSLSIQIQTTFGTKKIENVDLSKNINWLVKNIKDGGVVQNDRFGKFMGGGMGLQQKKKKRFTQKFIDEEYQRIQKTKEKEDTIAEGLKLMGITHNYKEDVHTRAKKIIDKVKFFKTYSGRFNSSPVNESRRDSLISPNRVGRSTKRKSRKSITIEVENQRRENNHLPENIDLGVPEITLTKPIESNPAKVDSPNSIAAKWKKAKSKITCINNITTSLKKAQEDQESKIDSLTSGNSKLLSRLFTNKSDTLFGKLKKSAGNIYHSSRVNMKSLKGDITNIPFAEDILMRHAMKTNELLTQAEKTRVELEKIEKHYMRKKSQESKNAERLMKNSRMFNCSKLDESKKSGASICIDSPRFKDSVRVGSVLLTKSNKNITPRALHAVSHYPSFRMGPIKSSSEKFRITMPFPSTKGEKRSLKLIKRNASIPTEPSVKTVKDKAKEHIQAYIKSLDTFKSTRGDWDFVKDMKLKGSKIAPKDSLSQEVTLAGILKKYLTKPEDAEIMEVANAIYYHGGYGKRKKIIMKSLASSAEFKGYLQGGGDYKQIIYTSKSKELYDKYNN